MAPMAGNSGERHLHAVGADEAERQRRIQQAREEETRAALSGPLSRRVGRDLGDLAVRDLRNIAKRVGGSR